ncbi:MAG: FHA domain-containing protein [Deltaproteobacteria bacterium]|nr:FHA domain-containing protein [Deltaproteobacteria bacterium]
MAVLKLLVTIGTHTEEKTLPITEGTAYTVGRKDCWLTINEITTSRRHLNLELKNGGLLISDLGSTHGTEVNHVKINGLTCVGTGDEIKLGETRIKIIQLDPGKPSAKTTLTPPLPAKADLPARAVAVKDQRPKPYNKPGQRDSVSSEVTSNRQTLPHKDATAQYSRPGERIRHSYPVHAQDSGIKTVVTLYLKTLPYALVRFGILFMASIITIIYGIICFGGFGYLFKAFPSTPIPAYAWLLVTGGAGAGLWGFVVRYALYMVKAGHIAVLTEVISHGSVQNGTVGMFAYGRQKVKTQFKQVNILFLIDSFVRAIVRAFNRTTNLITSWLPIPGLARLMAVVNRIVYVSASYIDETILSYNLARGDDNPWRSSKDGVIYYCQNYLEILKTAVLAVILDYIATFIVWIICLVPAYAAALIIPRFAFLPFILAFLLALPIRGAVVQPLMLIMIILKFHVRINNQEINLEWDERLSKLSKKFKGLTEKAKAWGAVPESSAIQKQKPRLPLT